ncbi:protein kinase family protein [Oerskovia sp. Root22]|uniref:serine/threonine protein kinase n=1 Tax=Oerskovia sp. Root22 TaxID=1736494 RepID=UPI0006F6FC50|nr:protein kinase family protein [Oerskovia sp. Root22]KRC39992.1 hypothetical protein ASE15_19380 [Oerskovia sp. Root22]
MDASENQEASAYVGVVLDSRWKIIEPLASGHFGIVYLAHDADTNEPAVIKILKVKHSGEPEHVQDFLDEARFLTVLAKCDNVVEMFGSGRYPHVMTSTAGGFSAPVNAHYIAMEAADCSLTDLLVENTEVFTWPERLGILRDVVQGVQQMHQRSIVNRDLKAENVLVFSAPHNELVAKVSDMGRAKSTREARRSTIERYAIPRGDWRFAAPEHIWCVGSDDPLLLRATDLYHTGSVLFELVTGLGLTSVVLPTSAQIAASTWQLQPDQRTAQYELVMPDLRNRFELVYEQFAENVPRTIRTPLTALLRQLTDVDPMRRFRRVRGRPDCSDSLSWLINRIDVIALQLRRAEIEAKRRERKKTMA